MQDKKYQVFVSSTYTDLQDARSRVIDQILKLHQFPIGMEMFTADDDEQWTIIKELIADSDYYVVIIGHRYGSVTSEGVSYTEKEYDLAKELGVPIMAFIMKDEVALKPHERETDAIKIDKLQKFRDKASANKLVNFWSDVRELDGLVTASLYHAFIRHPRVGWVRADKAVSDTMVNELAELVKSNRELREENETLRSKMVDRVPDFSLLFNGTSEISLTYGEPDQSWHSSYDPLSMSDVPEHLLEFVTEEQLQEYNESLPDDELVTAYREARATYDSLLLNGEPVSISFHNTGTAKAVDINVTIEFPEEIIVKSKSDWEALEEPTRPKKLVSPIQRASEKYTHKNLPSIMGSLDFSNILAQQTSVASMVPYFRQSSFSDVSSLIKPNLNRSLSAEDGSITIWIKDLLHRHRYDFEDEFVLIPTKVGTFEASVSIICEELPYPIENKIVVRVSEENHAADS